MCSRLTVVYRYTPESQRSERWRPAGFSKAGALQSLVDSLRRLDEPWSMHIIADMDAATWSEDAVPRSLGCDVTLLGGKGSGASFAEALRVATEIRDDSLVLLAEDDYLYRPEAMRKLLDAFVAAGPDRHAYYYSLYDHPDAYKAGVGPAGMRTELVPLGGHMWHTAPSTCMTFAASSLRLSRDRRLLRAAAGGRGTSSWALFDALVRRQRIRPSISLLGRDSWRVRPTDLAATLLKSRDHLRLLCPIPSLATHASRGYLPYSQSWSDYGLDGA